MESELGPDFKDTSTGAVYPYKDRIDVLNYHCDLDQDKNRVPPYIDQKALFGYAKPVFRYYSLVAGEGEEHYECFVKDIYPVRFQAEVQKHLAEQDLVSTGLDQDAVIKMLDHGMLRSNELLIIGLAASKEMQDRWNQVPGEPFFRACLEWILRNSRALLRSSITGQGPRGLLESDELDELRQLARTFCQEPHDAQLTTALDWLEREITLESVNSIDAALRACFPASPEPENPPAVAPTDVPQTPQSGSKAESNDKSGDKSVDKPNDRPEDEQDNRSTVPRTPADDPNDRSGEQESDENALDQAISNLPRAERIAYLLFEYIQENEGKRLTYAEAWKFLKEIDFDEVAESTKRPDLFGNYELPTEGTFVTHVTRALNAIGQPRNRPRAGRESRSVVKSDKT